MIFRWTGRIRRGGSKEVLLVDFMGILAPMAGGFSRTPGKTARKHVVRGRSR